MSRILIAWELGGNYGHVAKLVPLTRALHENGHHVALAVKDVAALDAVLDRDEVLVVQAPHELVTNYRHKPLSFADVLENHGFGTQDRLNGLVRGWHGIFRLFRPDVVVAEYALSVVVAAKLAGIPSLRVDTGFGIPPEISPYPCFRPWHKLGRDTFWEKEKRILNAINLVRNDYGLASLEKLHLAVRADLSLLACFPELDHYGTRPGGRYIGPISSLEIGPHVHWQVGKGPRIFAYLRPMPALEEILKGMQAAGGQVIAIVPGIRRHVREQFGNVENFSIYDGPVQINQLLAESDIVVSHASSGLTNAALLHGVPTVGIPTHIEQLMLADTLERQGLGGKFDAGQSNASKFADALTAFLGNRELITNARNFAAKYSGYDGRKTMARLVKTIERLPLAIGHTK